MTHLRKIEFKISLSLSLSLSLSFLRSLHILHFNCHLHHILDRSFLDFMDPKPVQGSRNRRSAARTPPPQNCYTISLPSYPSCTAADFVLCELTKFLLFYRHQVCTIHARGKCIHHIVSQSITAQAFFTLPCLPPLSSLVYTAISSDPF